MALKLNTTIDGLDGMVRALRAVPQKLAKKTLRKAVGEGTKILLKATKSKVASVPVRTGLLKKSLGRKIKVYRAAPFFGANTRNAPGTTVGIVGPRKGFGQEIKGFGFVDPVKYAHLVEFGTRPHALGKGSKLKSKTGTKQVGARHPGARAQPFMRPAFDQSKAAIKQAMVQVIRDGLRQAALEARQEAQPAKRAA